MWKNKINFLFIFFVGFFSLLNPVRAEEKANELILIPAGEFEMGLKDNIYGWMISPAPAHNVYVDDFFINLYEVSNQEYGEFVKEKSIKEPPYWKQKMFANPQQPVVGINWFQADSFCRWKGLRLPTEAEWEKAASWNDKKKEKYVYPWGDDENNLHKKMNFWFTDLPYERGLMIRGSFKDGVSPYGIYDMAGSVWEWVGDWYEKDYYDKSPGNNPKGPESGEMKVIRGGSWGDYGPALKPINRGAEFPHLYYSTFGFRCVRSAKSR